MGLPETRESRIADIKLALEHIGNLDPDKLSLPELKTLSLNDARPLLEDLCHIFRQCSLLDASKFGDRTLDVIATRLGNASAIVNGIHEYAHNQGQTERSRDNQLRAIDELISNCYSDLVPILAYSFREQSDIEYIATKLQNAQLEASRELVAKLQEELARAQEIRHEIESLQPVIAEIARQAGVSTFAGNFQTEADAHSSSSDKWLRWTVILAVGTVVAGASSTYLYFKYLPSLTSGQSIQLGVSKLVVLSILVSATFWVGKTYRAHVHNSVVNRHRQNALSTFLAFAKATLDESTRNAILIQATQCIFNHQPTGYITSDTEGSHVSQVLEIVRNTGSKT